MSRRTETPCLRGAYRLGAAARSARQPSRPPRICEWYTEPRHDSTTGNVSAEGAEFRRGAPDLPLLRHPPSLRSTTAMGEQIASGGLEARFYILMTPMGLVITEARIKGVNVIVATDPIMVK